MAHMQIIAMAGACDHVTVAPGMLAQLVATAADSQSATAVILPATVDVVQREPALSREQFDSLLAADAAGTEVLRTSTEGFLRDTVALEQALSARAAAAKSAAS
jgi:transaldolase